MWAARSVSVSHAKCSNRKAFLPSFTLHLQHRPRPFVWLFARTWLLKNTGCFAVYAKGRVQVLRLRAILGRCCFELHHGTVLETTLILSYKNSFHVITKLRRNWVTIRSLKIVRQCNSSQFRSSIRCNLEMDRQNFIQLERRRIDEIQIPGSQQIWQENKQRKMTFLCMIALKTKTVAHIFLPSFDKAVATSIKKDCWDPKVLRPW